MKCVNLGLQQRTVFSNRWLLPRVLLSTLLFVVACSAASPQTSSKSWQELVAEADTLRARWTAASWREAIKKYETALAKLPRSALSREEARVLGSLGMVYLAVGDTRLAQQNLTRSLRILQELKAADSEMVDTLNNLANSHILISNYEQARTYCKESLNLSRSLGYLKGEGWALELMGQVEYFSGNLLGSLDLYRAALPALKQANDEAGVAQAFLDLGLSYSDLSETENALQSFEQSLVSWRAIGNPRGEALTLTVLGHLRSKLGEKQVALDLYYQSIQLLQPLEDRLAMAYNFDGLGFIHAGLGETSTALREYTKTFELFREANFAYGQASILWKIAEIHITNEDYKTALLYLNKSLALSHSIRDPRLESIPTALIAKVHERQNQPAQALAVYKRALMLNRKGKDTREEAYTLNSIGRIQEAFGSREEALGNYTQALALNRLTRDRFGEAGTLYRIAKIQHTMGKLKEAQSSAEQSISLVESLRAGVASHDLRSSYVATVHELYEAYIDILMSLHALEPAAGFAQAALEASEAGRARTLLEILAETKAQIREGVDPKLLERERTLQRGLDDLATRQVKSLDGSRLEVEAEIERLTSEYRDVQGQIRAHSPQYSALVQPVTLKVKQIQQLLEPGTLLLEYSLGERRSFLWAITHDSVKSYALPAQADIQKIAQRLYSAIITIGRTVQRSRNQPDHSSHLTATNYESDARSLSSILLGQVAELSHAKRLVIVPDGVLQYIPFGALPQPAAETQPHSQTGNLVAGYEIVRLPSASVLAMQRAQFAQRVPSPKSVAVLADPVFDRMDRRVMELRSTARSGIQSSKSSKEPAGSEPLKNPPSSSRALREAGVVVNGRIQRLIFSLEEAEAVYAASPQTDALKAVWFKASRATATSPELSQYKIIHIATHGVLNSKHPELSGILLSMIDETGKPVEGFLQLHEIYNLKLPAELVVLSACETGIGKEIRGEGFIALTRGFMYAGAARVIASLWKVDDSSTAALMAEFYRQMFTNGKRPAEALKEAQISISKQKRWRDPYFWAGFVLQGEWR